MNHGPDKTAIMYIGKMSKIQGTTETDQYKYLGIILKKRNESLKISRKETARLRTERLNLAKMKMTFICRNAKKYIQNTRENLRQLIENSSYGTVDLEKANVNKLSKKIPLLKGFSKPYHELAASVTAVSNRIYSNRLTSILAYGYDFEGSATFFDTVLPERRF